MLSPQQSAWLYVPRWIGTMDMETLGVPILIRGAQVSQQNLGGPRIIGVDTTW